MNLLSITGSISLSIQTLNHELPVSEHLTASDEPLNLILAYTPDQSYETSFPSASTRPVYSILESEAGVSIVFTSFFPAFEAEAAMHVFANRAAAIATVHSTFCFIFNFSRIISFWYKDM